MTLKNCWEIKQCGRQTGGAKVDELGVCPAAQENLGHYCWIISGTFCGGTPQGTFAQKELNCLSCEVYQLYDPMCGTLSTKVQAEHPEESQKFIKRMRSIRR